MNMVILNIATFGLPYYALWPCTQDLSRLNIALLPFKLRENNANLNYA